MKKIIGLLFVLILFIGCATQNITGTEKYNEVLLPASNEAGNIIIKRDRGAMGSALVSNLFIDNEFLVRLRQGEFVRIQLKDGTHFITVSSAKGVNLGTAFERTLRVDIVDNTVRTFRVFPMPTQGILIEETLN